MSFLCFKLPVGSLILKTKLKTQCALYPASSPTVPLVNHSCLSFPFTGYVSVPHMSYAPSQAQASAIAGPLLGAFFPLFLPLVCKLLTIPQISSENHSYLQRSLL